MRLRLCCMALLTLFSVGCERAAGPGESEYLVRLARVLDAPQYRVPEFEPHAFPARRQLLQAVAAPTLDWTEFARLHRCDMGDLAGFRNSGLGRVMDALGRLEYELRWLAAAQRCLELQGPRAEQTVVLLQSLIAQKRALLPALFTNAVFAQPAMQRWQGEGDGSADAAVHLLALSDQARALAQLETRPERIDAALQGLDGSRRVATAQRQWAEARALLLGATELLQSYADNVCRNGQPTPRARRLRNLFHRFYVDQEQPRIASVVNGDADWVQALVALPATTAVSPPPALAAWIAKVLDAQDGSSAWQRTRSAFVGHAKAWQALGEQCALDLFSRNAG